MTLRPRLATFVAVLAASAVVATGATLLSPAAAAATYSTATTWAWAFNDLASGPTASANEYVQASVTGLADKDKNAAFVLRRSSGARLIVNLSGTRYQIWSDKAGSWTSLLDIARPLAGASGTARVEVSGSTVKTTWNGVVLDARSLSAASTLTGTGTGVGIWQNSAYAVSMTNIVSGPLSSSPTPSPTTPAPTPTTPTPTATGSPAPAYDANGVWLGVPSASTSATSASLTASVKASTTRTFRYLQIAVRDSSGRGTDSSGASLDVAYRPGAVVTPTAPLTLTGSRSYAAGTYTAQVAYSLNGSTWSNGPKATFRVGTTTTPTTPPTTSPTATTSPTTSPTVTPTSTTSPRPATAFVTRNGTNLLLNGRKWQFVGYNSVHMLGCTTSDRAVNDIEGYFARAGKGMTDRIWVLPGADMAKVDRIIAAAKANGSRVYFTLSDANGACGDPGGKKSSAWYTSGWTSTHKAHFTAMATRYKNEPTIAFWELINESAGDGNAVKTFNTNAANLIKGIDPNHLISSGTMPDYAFGGASGWTAANSPAGVDITSIHEYDENQVQSSWLLADLKLSQAMNKPILVGEFGIEASQSGGGTRPIHGGTCQFTYTSRASRAQAKLDGYIANPGVAGVNYWAYSQKSRTGSDCDTELGPNDTQLQAVFTAKAKALQ